MKFNKREFVGALAKVMPFIGKHSTLPVLAGVLIECKNGKLLITGSDLEKCATARMNHFSADFAFVVDASLIQKTVRAVKSDEFELTLKEGESCIERILIKDGKYKADLPCMLSDDYPIWNSSKIVFSEEVEVSRLSFALSFVNPAVSANDSRKVLQGVLFDVCKGYLQIVATDGKRCHIVELPEGGDRVDSQTILPKKSVQAFLSVLKNYSEQVDVELGTKDCCLLFDDLTIHSKLIEGKFPNYRQIMPDKFSTTVKVNCAEFLSAFDAVTSVVEDQTNEFVAFEIDTEIRMQVSNATRGIVKDACAIDEPLSDTVKISMAPAVFRSSIPNCDILAIDFNDGFSPVRMRSAGNDAIYSIIMPMRNK